MKIENLTEHQVTLLDIMWSLSSSEELDYWMATLDEYDLNTVIVLRQLTVYEYIDDVVSAMNSNEFVEAKLILSQF